MRINTLQFFVFLVVGLNNLLQAQNLPPKPNPAKYVNDFAGFMSAEEVKTLEQKLYKYADTTSTQIVVVTISSLQGATIEKYANDLARNWGIGQKDKNNGLLILIAKQERKIRIEVGYGLEGKVPDQLTADIQELQMRPNFKNNQYYKGLDEATDVLFDALKGEFKGTTTKVSQGQHDDMEIFMWVAGVVILVIIVIVVGIWLSNISEKNNKRNNRNNGGSYSDYSDSSSSTTVIWGGGTSSYSDYSDKSYSDTSSYSDSSYSDSSFGGGDFGGGGSSSDW
ncbi:MAG TPA: methanol dehydrogenase [Microscillaceae bacterium]|nr:methanol dehydrogenase [Microscillaceae bacterium]